jgi:hypothetical protein
MESPYYIGHASHPGPRTIEDDLEALYWLQMMAAKTACHRMCKGPTHKAKCPIRRANDDSIFN